MWRQSRGSSAWRDAIAAWITYGPRPPSANARSSSARPRAICSVSHARAVLVGEQHELAVTEPGLATRVVEQHHREQAVRLGLVGHQLDERPAEPQRLRREVGPAAVALVEDEVHDGEHGGEPVGEQVRRAGRGTGCRRP